MSTAIVRWLLRLGRRKVRLARPGRQCLFHAPLPLACARARATAAAGEQERERSRSPHWCARSPGSGAVTTEWDVIAPKRTRGIPEWGAQPLVRPPWIKRTHRGTLPHALVSGKAVRSRGSSPKLQVFKTALLTARTGITPAGARADREFWGRLTESAVGAHLINAVASGLCEVYYWRERNREVDYVLKKGRMVVALEVKSGRAPLAHSGLAAFSEASNPNAPCSWEAMASRWKSSCRARE